jgi:2-iminobutanoate/2-iminopropanoate deaminase
MRKRNVVRAPGAPQPIGPYSVGIQMGEMLYTAGMAGVDPQTGKLVPGGIEAETRQTLRNLASILEAGGSSLAAVVKTTVFLQDMGEFSKMNAVYREFFPADPPARSTVQVAALPLGARVEIEAIGARLDAHGD